MDNIWNIAVIIGSFALGGIVFPIVVNITSNWLSDPIKDYLQKRWLINRFQSAEKLKKEMVDIKHLIDNPVNLYIEVSRRMVELIVAGLIGIMLIVAEIYSSISREYNNAAFSDISIEIEKVVFYISVAAALIYLLYLSYTWMSFRGKIADYNHYEKIANERLEELSKHELLKDGLKK
jgi:hypothetical protein